VFDPDRIPKAVPIVLVLVGKLLVFSPLLGQTASDETGSGANEREDTQEILAALEEAGLSATEVEQRSWSDNMPRTSQHSPGSILGWTRGEMSSRWSGKILGQPLGQLKLDLRNGWSRWRGRVDWGAGSTGLKSGAVRFVRGRQSLTVGIMGLQSGVGLLMAAPGRNGSLAADSGFIRPGERVSLWSSAPDDRTMGGVGLETGRGPWTVRALIGNRVILDEEGSRIRMGSISRLGQLIDWGSTVVTLGSQIGYGIWAGKKRGPLQWRGGWANWHGGSDSNQNRSLEAVVSIQLGPRWAVQTGLASASGGHPSPLAARSPFLKGDEGSGWGIRGWWRSKSGVKYSVLWARSTTNSTQPSAQKNGHTILDMTTAWKYNPATEFLFRFRTTEHRQWEWSDRFRWAAPFLDQEEQQQLLQAGVSWQPGPLVLRFKMKHLLKIRDEVSGKRTMYRLSGRNYWGPFHLRWAFGTAWGQEVDLVDAVCPVPGLVQPRHWGKWQTETQLGLGLRAVSLDLWVAGIRRKPTQANIVAGSSQFWALIGRKW